jgi:PAS domain S-box-containing protein
MDGSSDLTQQIEIALLRQRLDSLRRLVDEMDDLLARYVESEQALRESEERFHLLVEGVRDYAIFMLDPDGHVTSWNSGAQLMKGYDASEILGRHFSLFYPPEDVAAGKPERVLSIARTEGRYEEEGWRVRKSGSLFWANVLITPLYDTHGQLRGFAKVTRDMTERKQAAEERERLRERELQLAREREARIQTEAMVRARDQFLTVAAHELRTPLTALLANAQLLQRHAQRQAILPERDQRIAKVIVEQAARLNQMIMLLLDISRMQEGRLSIERVPLDLGALAQQVVEEVRPGISEHTLTYVGPDAPLFIEGDALRLGQVLHNLLQNAIKYSPQGGPVVVQVGRQGDTACLEVIDQGIGIPEASLPQLFQRFFRAPNADERNFSGLGVGLYVVKEVVSLHGGTVSVASEEGRGSTFTVRLPLLASPPELVDELPGADSPAAS